MHISNVSSYAGLRQSILSVYGIRRRLIARIRSALLANVANREKVVKAEHMFGALRTVHYVKEARVSRRKPT